MDTSTTLIILAGLGAAGFLYWKSQQDQAAALAAANAAQGPGLLGKAENTLKQLFSANTWHAISGAGKAAVSLPLQAGTSITSHVATYAGDAVGFVKGLF